MVHALALKTFYPPYDQPSCIDLRPVSAYLDGHAPGVGESPAGRRSADRHAAWASRLPRESAEVWSFVAAMDGSDLLGRLAHCVSLTVSALQNPLDRRPPRLGARRSACPGGGPRHVYDLDGDRPELPVAVTKARILEAVAEGVSRDAAERISGLKKAEMVEAAEQALAGTGWLPPLLRTTPAAVAGAGELRADGQAVAAE